MKVDTTVCIVVLLALLASQEVQGHNNNGHGHRGWRNNINRRFDIGYALRFDGSDWVSLPSMDLGTPLSFEFLYRTGRTGGGTLFSFQSGSAYIRLSLTTSNNNFGSFVLEVGNPNNRGEVTPRIVTSDAEFPKNDKWQYVVIIYKHNGQVQFYLEESETSVLKDTENIQTSLNWRTFNQNFIGRRTDGSNTFVGDLDEVRFWTKELSAEDDRDRTRDIDPSNQRSLQAWYNFNQGLGFVATDVAFKGKDGVLGSNVLANAPQWIVAGFTSTRTCKAFGDPHIKTFDRACFRLDNSRVGDFWLVDSANYGIQARIATKPGSGRSTSIIGIAFQFGSDIHAVFDLDFRSKSDSVLTIGNNTVVPTGTYVTPTGISILKEWLNSNKHTYEIDVPYGFSALITAWPRHKYAEITVRVPEATSRDAVVGICGNFDDNRNNDGDTTYWPVDIDENLFLGPTDIGDPDLAYDCNIDTAGLPAETVARAHQICDNPAIVLPYLRDACLFDVCSTGDIGAAFASAEISYFECLENNNNGTAEACPKPCPNFCSFNGNCSSVDGTCTCNPGQFGADCSQTRNYRCYSASWLGGQTDIAAFGGMASIQNHYKYSTTYGFSSDTGKELSDTSVAYIYEERAFGRDPKVSLVFINDKARDGSEGRAKVDFQLSNGFQTAQISPRDDPDDTYTTNSLATNGRFTADWEWWKCCTDGLALGPLPNNFCLNMNMTVRQGINQIVVSSDNLFGTQDVYRVDSNSFKICGAQCNNTCGVYSDCSSCTADSNCGWCVETETCELGSAAGPDRGRCNLWRYASDATTSRVVKTQIGYPVDPASIEVYVPNGSPAQANFFVTFPKPELMPVDIALLVDLTRSAATELAYVQSATAGAFGNVLGAYPQARIAIGSFSDRPESTFGSAGRGDIAYAENLAFTDKLNYVQVALNSLVLKDGGDDRNSQLEALLKAANSQSLNWRSKSMKIVVIVTKTLPHLPPNSFYSNSALDYPSVAAVGNALITNNVIPVFVVPHTIADQYQSFVNTWGFGYVTRIVDGNVASIYPTVLDTVTAIAQSVRAIPISTGQPNNFASPAVYPANGYTGISPGTRVQFTANFVNNGATAGAILVPGFGTVNFKFITSDLPYLVGSAPTLTVTDGRASDIITLQTAGYYSPGSIQVLTLPSASVAVLYTVGAGNTQGTPITANSIIVDPENKIYVRYVGSGSTSFTFRVIDGCLASSATYTVSISYRGANQAPVAVSFNQPAVEDTAITITLQGSDPDNNTPLRYYIVTKPDASFASLTGVSTLPALLSQNTVQLVPVQDRFGTVTFTYRVVDALGASSNDATVTVAISNVNDVPTAIPTSVSVTEDTPTLVNLAGTDGWGETLPQNLIRNVVQTPQKGYLSLTPRGAVLGTNLGNVTSVYYNPSQDSTGADSFTFTVTDGNNAVSGPAPVSITITAVNDAPTSWDQTFSGDEDNNVTIVLNGNDVDNTQAQLRAVICSWSGVGKLFDGTSEIAKGSTNYAVQSTSRTLTYIPPANANASPLDTFTFRITDPSSASSPCFTGRINISPVNDRPVAIAPTTVYVNESDVVSITLRGSDVDVGDHPLSFVICQGVNFGSLSAFTNPIQTQPDMSETTVTYTAIAGQRTVTFSFQVVDNRTASPPALASNCVTVTIQVQNVNKPPTAVPVTANGVEDTDLFINLNGTDPDLDNLIYIVQSLPSFGSLYETSGGVKTTIITTPLLPRTLSNNQVAFVPDANVNGIPLTSFTFSVQDDILYSQPATVTISLQAQNDVPVASPFSTNTRMNTGVIISGFLATDIDNIDSDISFEVFQPTRGTLTTCGTEQTDPNCSSGSLVTGWTPIPSRRVLYTPPTGEYSVTNETFAIFNYRARDLADYSANATVSIVVFFVNSPPSASVPNTPIVTDAGECVQFQVESSDPDGDDVDTYVLWSDFVGRLFQNDNGNLGDEILSNGTTVSDSEGYVWYCAPATPGGRVGEPLTSLLFQARDSRGAQSDVVAVEVFVIPPPELPKATTTGKLIPEDTKVDFMLEGSDANIPNEVFTCVITGLPALGSLFVYQGPEITSFPYPLAGCHVEYQAESDDNGLGYARFNYTVTGQQSGKTSAEGIVVIDISAVPDAPTGNTPVPETLEDTSIDFQIQVTDPDIGRPSDSFTITIFIAPVLGGLFNLDTNGNVVGPRLTAGQTITNPDLWVRFTPDPSRSGIDSFTYTIDDSYGLSTPLLNLPIIINSVNDAPVAFSLTHSGKNNVNITDINLLATDVDSTGLVFFLRSLPTKGVLFYQAVVPGNEVRLNVAYAVNSFKYVINNFYEHGANYDQFTWQAFDGSLFSGNTTDTISIDYVNTPPSLSTAENQYTTEDEGVQITLIGSDVDNDPVTFEIITFPSKGVLYDSDQVTPIPSGFILPNPFVLWYMPNPNANTFGAPDDFFQIIIRDNLDANAINPFIYVRILARNDRPVINAPEYIVSDAAFGSTPGIELVDDSSEDTNAVVSVNVSSTGASSIYFTDASGLTGYTGPARSLVMRGTLANINRAFRSGLTWVPESADTFGGSIDVKIDDLGSTDATGNPALFGIVSRTINVEVQQEESSGGAAFIGVGGVLSAAAFGAYKYMKKKKLIPEEADPWENDELFDMTLDNPLYSGTSPSSLEAVFDK